MPPATRVLVASSASVVVRFHPRIESITTAAASRIGMAASNSSAAGLGARLVEGGNDRSTTRSRPRPRRARSMARPRSLVQQTRSSSGVPPQFQDNPSVPGMNEAR